MPRMIPLVLVLATACAARTPKLEFLARPNALGPFSEAVRVGDVVFLSGVLGTDSTGRLVPGGIGLQDLGEQRLAAALCPYVAFRGVQPR